MTKPTPVLDAAETRAERSEADKALIQANIRLYETVREVQLQLESQLKRELGIQQPKPRSPRAA